MYFEILPQKLNRNNQANVRIYFISIKIMLSEQLYLIKMKVHIKYKYIQS
jgi:hypothetical protein